MNRLRKTANIIFAPATRQDDTYEMNMLLYQTKNQYKISAMLQSLTIGQAVYFKVFDIDNEQEALALYDRIVTVATEFRDQYEYNELSSQGIEKHLQNILSLVDK